MTVKEVKVVLTMVRFSGSVSSVKKQKAILSHSLSHTHTADAG